MTMITGSEPQNQQTYHSQVYLATHEKAANSEDYQRLDPRYRSFISFKYDGIDIEDFDLIAITENNAMQRPLYAEFEDQVTEYAAWDGQIYWSSHHKAKTMDFALFTDGIDEKMLNKFQQHFRPGKTAELILAEHPNRAILARVAKAPEMSMLPFSKEITIGTGKTAEDVEITNYKGRINLSFVMDDPFWYNKYYTITQVQNNLNLTSNKEVYKICYEDGCIQSYDVIEGSVSGAEFNTGDPNNSSLGQRRYLYYGGTAPSYPIVKFTISLSNFQSDISMTLLFKNNNSHRLILTPPSLIKEWNKAAAILANGTNWQNNIRDQIKHYKIRKWYSQGEAGTISGSVTITIDCRTGEAIGEFNNVKGESWTEQIGNIIIYNSFCFDQRCELTDNFKVENYSDLYNLTISNSNITNLRMTYKYLYY